MRAISHPPIHYDLRITVQRHSLVAYFVAAYTLSWAIALPLAAVAQGLLPLALPLWLHYLTAFGPALAALLVTRIVDGPEGVRSLANRVFKWRIGLDWFLFAAASPVVLYALIALGVVVLGGAPPDLRELGTISFLPYLGVGAWLLWILTNGFGEEIGWRGFALPRLQQGHSALSATLILGSLWAFWHVPFFFYLPNFRAMGLLGFPGLALGILCGAVVLTWLYNSTNGSVLAASLWHGAFNFVTASAAGQGTVAMIVSIVVMVWAILIVVLFKPASLSRASKQTGT
jgi:uncharacterized protein